MNKEQEINEIVRAIRPSECIYGTYDELDCNECEPARKCFYYYEALNFYEYLAKRIAEERGKYESKKS